MYAVRLWSVRHARALRRVYEFCSSLAPRLAPLVRLLGRRRAEALLHPIERAAKGFMFDCRECGQCVLSATGMACPMNCAKQMRNGPCGGVRADGSCEVDPAMRCVWVEATEGNKRISAAPGRPKPPSAPLGGAASTSERGGQTSAAPGRPKPPSAPLGGAASASERGGSDFGDAVARPTPLLPAIDMRKAGQSTWIQVIEGRPDPAFQPPVGARSLPESEIGPLERACADGRFVVTVEIAPPDSADPQALLARAARFDGLADALNITDGAGANCHMSSVAGAAILAAHGYNPVYQVACRDRNRIAIQGDILGAAALGVKNILCLTGDDVSQGDHPQAKPVFDLDAVSLLHIARGMCDRGEFASGRKLERAPDLFIGATVNPFVPPYRDRVANLEKKIVAGARFIQTQFCFDVALFEDFMHEVRRRQLHRRTRIIVGVGTLASAKALAWMARHVPGVHVPQSLLERIARADDQKLEGQRACIETIAALRQIEGVAGVHVMGHRNEDALAGIIEQALGRR